MENGWSGGGREQQRGAAREVKDAVLVQPPCGGLAGEVESRRPKARAPSKSIKGIEVPTYSLFACSSTNTSFTGEVRSKVEGACAEQVHQGNRGAYLFIICLFIY
jgi:hypothetical protein